MADGAVRFLLQTIGSLLAKEAFMLGSLRRELEYIKSKLEIIQSFLKDSDSSKESSSSQKRTWRRQLNDVAYDVVDLIDEFIYHMDKHEHRGRFMGFLHNAVSLPRSIFVSHGIATRLHEIKAKLLDISESAKLLPHEESSSSHDAGESWPFYAESSHFAVEEELVGIEENKDELIGWLKDKEPQRRVISVVGMGGLGKTILVTKVFNSPAVKEHFHCYAWISVSQSYKIEELLQRVIKELYASKEEDLPNNIYQMDYRRLVEMLLNYLQDKRYVIVLDDVWNIQAWDDISIAIPTNHCGSRVMLTSRNRNLRVEGKVFHLQPLKCNEAWELFCRKAFWNIPKRRCPQELEPAAKQIVGKCEGLPLAIVAIGGIMSRKERRELEWKKIEDGLSWELINLALAEFWQASYSKQVMAAELSSARKRVQREWPKIWFSDADLEGIPLPHNDPLIVTLKLKNCTVQGILIDPGSSSDVLYFDCFKRMGLTELDLQEARTPLIGFNAKPVYPKGRVTLRVEVGGASMLTDFLVVDALSPYNAIMGRTWLHNMEAVPSTYHQKLKFPLEGRNGRVEVVTVRGDQQTAKQCLMTVVSGEREPKQVNMAEMEKKLDEVGQDLETKSVEDLTEIRINPNDPERFFLFGSQLAEPEKSELVQFLVQNREVFA